jgi:hypothetical protein
MTLAWGMTIAGDATIGEYTGICVRLSVAVVGIVWGICVGFSMRGLFDKPRGNT